MFKLSKRDAVKFVANAATIGVAATATETALNTIINDPDEDNANIHTGSLMIGAVIGFHTKRYTDKVVDAVADRRAARKARKNQTAEVAAV